MKNHPALRVTESDLRFLRSDWRALTTAYASGAADRWLGVLNRHYASPDRHYHNLLHVAEGQPIQLVTS